MKHGLALLAAMLLCIPSQAAEPFRFAESDLPKDPYDAVKLENDVLGVRVWGPPTQPTLSLGKSDLWDRRWFGDRQPVVTLKRLRELALADRFSEVAGSPNQTVYDAYGKYDFPCPKPGAQLILGTPFAATARVEPDGSQGIRLTVAGHNKKLVARVWVAVARPLVVVECQAEGLQPDDFWVRVWRHRDTIAPGEPVSPTLGGGPSAKDFEQMSPPRAHETQGKWGIAQDFPAERTFPGGFRVVASAAVSGAQAQIACQQDERGLGTPLWAPQEGRLNHGIVKRYRPINEAVGAAATAGFRELPESFVILATIATTQDGPDPIQVAARALDDAAALGLVGLREEQAAALKRGQRTQRAVARLGGKEILAAPAVVLPSLRKPDGYYGDVPLCSVGSTKFCFQDAGLWHDDFHLNEIRAEGMLALGQSEELLPYCQMIRTLLAQAQENAREVYGLPGAMYPLVHFPLRCRGIAHTNLTWEQDMGLNGLVTKPLWLYYRYTGDKTFLRDVAYPVLRECARFNAAYLSEEKDGRLHLVPTVSPEHWGLTARFERNRDCTSALTLTGYLLRAACAAAEVLGQDPQEAASWKTAAGRLAPYPSFSTPAGPVWVDVAGAPPIEYNVPVPLSPVFWGDDVGLDSPADVLALANRTLDGINVWAPHRGYLDACVRPRLGIVRPGAAMGPEHLLLSYQSIRLFPATASQGEIVMENFAAEGGFRVSAVRTGGGDIRDVRIESVLGGECRVANPWPGRAVEIAAADGSVLKPAEGDKPQVAFPTAKGKTYTLRPR
jgi:hypothetical protein